MRKEAVNTFNEGLNFDLNPLTTPNNVLTDCVNGTFITFNGDELALQNDAGNTRIRFNLGDEDNPNFVDVQLTEGFYPIGIKEYGGVLYIVSGKKPDDMGTLWDEENTYSIDDVVFFEVEDKKHYYISKTDSNDNSLPVESNDYWFYVGTEEDYINYAGEVEFGSYPSPEASGQTEFIGKELERYISADDNFKIENLLYNPTIINNQIFKSGRKIKFENYLGSDFTYISSHEIFDYIPRFYKIKLWHQLNNGFQDLTDFVWNQYKVFKGVDISGNFWFNDPDFYFYCPTQYKGKLAISAEIEEISKFELESLPELTYDSEENEYNFVLSVRALGIGDISVEKVKIETWVDNSVLSNETVDVINEIATEFIIIPIENSNQVINYRITPIITVNGLDYLEELPEEYLNKFVISGSRLISSEFDVVRIGLGKFECVPNESKREYTELILKDDTDSYIDLDINPVEDPYVFLKVGETPTDPDSIIVQYYNVSSTTLKPVLVSDLSLIDNEPIPEIIKDIVENTVVVATDNTCGFVMLHIILSSPINRSNEISVIQGIPISPEGISDGVNMYYKLSQGVLFNVNINVRGYRSIIDNNNSISENTTYSYGLIANITFREIQPQNKVYGEWMEQRQLFSGGLTFNLINVSPTILTLNLGVIWYGDINLDGITYPAQAQLANYTPVYSGVYKNITSDASNYGIYEGVVFSKSYYIFRDFSQPDPL